MKVIQVSDEIYEQLKECVVDPFDDTPDSVISRLIDIVHKAKTTWSPLDSHIEDGSQQEESQAKKPDRLRSWRKQAEPVL